VESSDVLITIEPGNNGIELTIKSSVINQYGRQIKATVLETLKRLDVSDARVTVVDKGALDCTLRARLECAVFRSNGMHDNIPWGVPHDNGSKEEPPSPHHDVPEHECINLS
jgi:citrate lyase subunit gamma (acyl carrier protein)